MWAGPPAYVTTADEAPVVFNGVNGASGAYLLPSMPLAQVARLTRGPYPDREHLTELRWWRDRLDQATFAPTEGVDPADLAEAGWGVIFAEHADPAVREALDELLVHRRRQATRIRERRYRELVGEDGYRPGESKFDYLAKHGVGPGPADPDRLPYYLLIVGDPETIPYWFQYQLDVQYAVGRIHFDRIADYAAYAHGVVAAETRPVARSRRLAFFATQNRNDPATAFSAGELVAPLAERLAEDAAGWEVQTVLGPEATKQRLTGLLGGAETPALLFTASHGVGFPAGDPRQTRHQGALVCQDWPGPREWQGPLPDGHYVSSGDIGTDAELHGLVTFHFACFGAGTPRWDDYAHGLDGAPRLAPRAFVAALPKRLLGHERGGALAVIGHVERVWTYSFQWPGAGRQTEVYRACLARLVGGHRIGSAFEYFNTRYVELSSDLSFALEQAKLRRITDPRTLTGMWAATNDARGFTVLGDPAVRLPGAAGVDGQGVAGAGVDGKE
jgi:hypothetical protein